MIQLYSYPFSPPADAARIALQEKGLEYKNIPVDLPGRQNRTDTFLARNFLGRVPVLVDGDVTLFESNVILEYLEEAYPTPRLLPTSPADRGLARQWMAIHQVDWHGLRKAIYHEGLLKPFKMLPGPSDRAAFSEARKKMLPHLDALEALRTRKGGPFLLGEYCLADVLWTPTLYILRKADVIPRTYPQVRAWAEACLARPTASRWLDGPPVMMAAAG